MTGHWTDMFSFTTGAVRFKDLVYLVITDDALRTKKTPHFGVIEWDAGTWRDGGRFKWNCSTCAVVRKPKHQMMAVGEFGNVLFMGSGDKHEETIATKNSSPEDRGPLRGSRFIGNHAYVVGMDRQVYRRDGIGIWNAVDEGARPPVDLEEPVGFEAIDGFSEKEMYAAGWDGEIWHFNGNKWKQVHSPTNSILTGLCCSENNVFICGQAGILIEGRKDKFRIIEQDVIEDDIWGLAWYQGSLFISTKTNIYQMIGDDIQIVDMGKDDPETCYHLSSEDDVLWSIGEKDVFAFDGKKWKRID